MGGTRDAATAWRSIGPGASGLQHAACGAPSTRSVDSIKRGRGGGHLRAVASGQGCRYRDLQELRQVSVKGWVLWGLGLTYCRLKHRDDELILPSYSQAGSGRHVCPSPREVHGARTGSGQDGQQADAGARLKLHALPCNFNTPHWT